VRDCWSRNGAPRAEHPPAILHQKEFTIPAKKPGTDKKPASGKKISRSPGNLVKNDKNEIELTEDDLKNVSGGTLTSQKLS
jgi:bacteriocin-like protein